LAVLAWLWGAALLLVAPAGTGTGESPEAIEYRVKAGYLFNFAKFVTWPARTAPASDGPFWIGLLDAGEVLPIIQPVLDGKEVQGRPIRIRPVKPGTLGRDLHILLVTRRAQLTPEAVAAELGGSPTLVVGETDEFALRGGTIGFVREGDVIRFALNLERAARSGLQVSAKLASVARLVKPPAEN
jgi:hypothetical protein